MPGRQMISLFLDIQIRKTFPLIVKTLDPNSVRRLRAFLKDDGILYGRPLRPQIYDVPFERSQVGNDLPVRINGVGK